MRRPANRGREEYTHIRPFLSFSISAAFWLVGCTVSLLLDPLTIYSAGINSIYFPAGIRLLIILAFGIWGALGIVVANPIIFELHFPEQTMVSHDVFEAAVNSLICGLVPFLTIWVARRLLRAADDFEKLTLTSLTIIAVAVSVITPVIFTITYVIFQYEPLSAVSQSLPVMILGDLVGCLIVIVPWRLTAHLRRMLADSLQ